VKYLLPVVNLLFQLHPVDVFVQVIDYHLIFRAIREVYIRVQEHVVDFSKVSRLK
jgi:hypothetical protein